MALLRRQRLRCVSPAQIVLPLKLGAGLISGDINHRIEAQKAVENMPAKSSNQLELDSRGARPASRQADYHTRLPRSFSCGSPDVGGWNDFASKDARLFRDRVRARGL